MANNEERVRQLLSQLKDEDEMLRETAAYLLGEIGQEAMELLSLSRKDKNALYQMNALVSDQLRDQVSEALVDLLFDSNSWVRGNAADALGKMGNGKASEPLILLLKDPEPVVRYSAAESLGKLGKKSAVGPLIDALKDEHWSVRCAAAKALGELGDGKAAEALETALKDDKRDVQLAAAEALEKIAKRTGVLLETKQEAKPKIAV